MVIVKRIAVLLLTVFTLNACFEDLDDTPISTQEINDFVWRGMNVNYLYKDNVPDLANDRFTSEADYGNFLSAFQTPETLFESLIYDRDNIDKFSWITRDYIALEQFLNGVSKSNGLEFDFYVHPGRPTEVFGVIRLVLKNSPAESLGLQRGLIFNAVNGITLTEDNFSELLGDDTYTLNFASYDDNETTTLLDDIIESNGASVTLTKTTFNENPVYRSEILEVEGQNVGYLLYNGFTADYNLQLIDAFSMFQSSGIQHLVLDLRYNPGGSVNTAVLLGSMITGQFNGRVFTKLEYNDDLRGNDRIYNFVNSYPGITLPTLNLNSLYILTTDASASASEMVINSLAPYIDVLQIGQQTTGKSQASVTIYDSPDFGRRGANPRHTYALQPLVAKTVNSLGQDVPNIGLAPSIPINENPSDYGVLGDMNEPLLATAIQHIIDNGRMMAPESLPYTKLMNTVDLEPYHTNMYID